MFGIVAMQLRKKYPEKNKKEITQMIWKNWLHDKKSNLDTYSRNIVAEAFGPTLWNRWNDIQEREKGIEPFAKMWMKRAILGGRMENDRNNSSRHQCIMTSSKKDLFPTQLQEEFLTIVELMKNGNN